MRTRSLRAVTTAVAAFAVMSACHGSNPAVCPEPDDCQCMLADAATCLGDDGGLVADGSVDASRDGSPRSEAGTDSGPSCDVTQDPKDNPSCVNDAYGVFVDATNGSDSNDGTKAQPFKTIAKALAVGSLG